MRGGDGWTCHIAICEAGTQVGGGVTGMASEKCTSYGLRWRDVNDNACHDNWSLRKPQVEPRLIRVLLCAGSVWQHNTGERRGEAGASDHASDVAGC